MNRLALNMYHQTQLKEWRTYFSLYFIIQELLLEGNEGVVCTVVVQIQWVQHIPASDSC